MLRLEMGNCMSANGVHTSRDASAQALLDRLNEPHTAAALHQLLDHAELLAYGVGALDGLARRGEELTDNVAASLDELRGSLPPGAGAQLAQLSRLAAQLPALIALTERFGALAARQDVLDTLDTLSSPATLSSLNKLVGHLELLAFGADAVDGALRRGEEFSENVRDSLRELTAGMPGDSADVTSLIESGARLLPYLPRLVQVAPKFIEVIERLEAVVASPEFDALLSSGVFAPETVSLVGRAGDAFVASYDENTRTGRRLGPVGLLRALNDPDVQRAAALVVDFGRRFGRSIKR